MTRVTNTNSKTSFGASSALIAIFGIAIWTPLWQSEMLAAGRHRWQVVAAGWDCSEARAVFRFHQRSFPACHSLVCSSVCLAYLTSVNAVCTVAFGSFLCVLDRSNRSNRGIRLTNERQKRVANLLERTTACMPVLVGRRSFAHLADK